MVAKTRVIKVLVAITALFCFYKLIHNCRAFPGLQSLVVIRQLPSLPTERVLGSSPPEKFTFKKTESYGQESLSFSQHVYNTGNVTSLSQKREKLSILQQPESQTFNYQLAPPLPTKFHSLKPNDIDSVEKFVFFVGYGRSGHSMVASIMDAHPDVIVAHEFFLFDKLSSVRNWTKKTLFDRLYHNSYKSAVSGWRANKRTSKGYNLNLRGSWQGQFRRLRVIGDKTAGATAMLFHESDKMFKSALARLQEVSGVSLRVVHVVRNPFDMIATVALYHASPDPDRFKVTATRENPFKNASLIRQAMVNIFNKAQAVVGIAKLRGFQLLEIHLEDLIDNSREIILKICHFLEVDCDEEYIKQCQAKIYTKASQSRHLVVWPNSTKSAVQRKIERIPFFSRYSFDN